jgi:hypothetical protein
VLRKLTSEVRDGSQRGKFPVGEMACKDQRRFAVEPQLRKQFVEARLDFDPAILGVRGIVLIRFLQH